MLINHRSGTQRSEAARAAILNSAATLFRSGGYERLTMEGIASSAKVGKQTIYRWWPSKSALIAECLAESYLLPIDRFTLSDSGSVTDDITEWLAALIEYFQSEGDGVFLSLVAAAAGDADVAHHLNDRFGGGQTLITRLQQAVESGELQSEVPVGHVSEALIGAVVVRLLGRTAMPAGFAGEIVTLVLGQHVRAAKTPGTR